MFDSIYSDQIFQNYTLCSITLRDSAKKHELCYLRRFDAYAVARLKSYGCITKAFINKWMSTLSGKSSSVENEIIVIRQFLNFFKKWLRPSRETLN